MINDYKRTILEISKRLKQSSYSKSLIQDVLQLNNKLASICHKSSEDIFYIIKKQYKNSQHLYDLGFIGPLSYKKIKYIYKLEKLKKSINEGLEFVNDYDYEDIYMLINILKESCTNDLMAQLPNNYVDDVTFLFNKMATSISSYKISRHNKDIIISDLKKLSHKYLSPTLGQSTALISQVVTVSITTLSKDFSTDKLSFKAEENKKSFEKNILVLKNNHIKKLSICENIYGASGEIDFELAYDNKHSDFEFLFDNKQLLLLNIEIVDEFDILEGESYKENRVSRTKYSMVGTVGDNSQVHQNFNTSLHSHKHLEIYSGIKEFRISFKDPLASLWKIHKPTYIDFHKSLEDIIFDNFHFNGIISLDTSGTKLLKEKIPQVFVSTVNRDFYDFFIEQLYLNECSIKYYTDPKSGKPTYYISDKIDSPLKESVKNTQDDVSQQFDPYDIHILKHQQITPNGLDSFIKKKIVNSDINGQDSVKEVQKDSIDSLYETVIQKPSYLGYNSDSKQALKHGKYSAKLESSNDLAYINTHLDLSKIDIDKVFLPYKNTDSVYLSMKKIHLIRSKYNSKQLYRNINDHSYKSDSEKDVYEKITLCEQRKLTHSNIFKYYFRDYEDLLPEYPVFRKYSSLNLIGKITIGKDTAPESAKAYKFFSDYQLKEDSFSTVQENKENGSNNIFDSKDKLLYALEVNKNMLAPKCDVDPIIFIPVKININSSTNEFMPLRNNDIVMVEISGISSCHAIEIVSNSAISIHTSDKKHIQRQNYGAKENCIVGYTEENDSEIYSIEQTNKNNDNSIFIHDKKGIFITYTSK